MMNQEMASNAQLDEGNDTALSPDDWSNNKICPERAREFAGDVFRVIFGDAMNQLWKTNIAKNKEGYLAWEENREHFLVALFRIDPEEALRLAGDDLVLIATIIWKSDSKIANELRPMTKRFLQQKSREGTKDERRFFKELLRVDVSTQIKEQEVFSIKTYESVLSLIMQRRERQRHALRGRREIYRICRLIIECMKITYGGYDDNDFKNDKEEEQELDLITHSIEGLPGHCIARLIGEKDEHDNYILDEYMLFKLIRISKYDIEKCLLAMANRSDSVELISIIAFHCQRLSGAAFLKLLETIEQKNFPLYSKLASSVFTDSAIKNINIPFLENESLCDQGDLSKWKEAIERGDQEFPQEQIALGLRFTVHGARSDESPLNNYYIMNDLRISWESRDADSFVRKWNEWQHTVFRYIQSKQRETYDQVISQISEVVNAHFVLDNTMKGDLDVVLKEMSLKNINNVYSSLCNNNTLTDQFFVIKTFYKFSKKIASTLLLSELILAYYKQSIYTMRKNAFYVLNEMPDLLPTILSALPVHESTRVLKFIFRTIGGIRKPPLSARFLLGLTDANTENEWKSIRDTFIANFSKDIDVDRILPGNYDWRKELTMAYGMMTPADAFQRIGHPFPSDVQQSAIAVLLPLALQRTAQSGSLCKAVPPNNRADLIESVRNRLSGEDRKANGKRIQRLLRNAAVALTALFGVHEASPPIENTVTKIGNRETGRINNVEVMRLSKAPIDPYLLQSIKGTTSSDWRNTVHPPEEPFIDRVRVDVKIPALNNPPSTPLGSRIKKTPNNRTYMMEIPFEPEKYAPPFPENIESSPEMPLLDRIRQLAPELSVALDQAKIVGKNDPRSAVKILEEAVTASMVYVNTGDTFDENGAQLMIDALTNKKGNCTTAAVILDYLLTLFEQSFEGTPPTCHRIALGYLAQEENEKDISEPGITIRLNNRHAWLLVILRKDGRVLTVDGTPRRKKAEKHNEPLEEKEKKEEQHDDSHVSYYQMIGLTILAILILLCSLRALKKQKKTIAHTPTKKPEKNEQSTTAAVPDAQTLQRAIASSDSSEPKKVDVQEPSQEEEEEEEEEEEALPAQSNTPDSSNPISTVVKSEPLTEKFFTSLYNALLQRTSDCFHQRGGDKKQEETDENAFIQNLEKINAIRSALEAMEDYTETAKAITQRLFPNISPFKTVEVHWIISLWLCGVTEFPKARKRWLDALVLYQNDTRTDQAKDVQAIAELVASVLSEQSAGESDDSMNDLIQFLKSISGEADPLRNNFSPEAVQQFLTLPDEAQE